MQTAAILLAACQDGTTNPQTTQLRLASAKLDNGQTIKLPVFVLTDVAQILQAFTGFFNSLASKGVVVHLMSRDYMPIK